MTPKPSPRHDLDRISAAELRARLERRGAAEWVAMASVRECFGGLVLSRARKREIARVLAAAGIDAYPPVDGLSGRDKVRLEALRAIGSDGVHKRGARRLWEQFRARLVARVFAAVGLAASLVTLAGVFGLLGGDQLGRANQIRMSGDLNIAIAPFTSHGFPSSDGLQLARATAEVLQSKAQRLDRPLNIEVRGPDDVGMVTGHGATDQAKSAHELASKIDADIVVYGEITVAPEGTSIEPAFYLNIEKLPWASSLSGRYGYGGKITEPYSIDVNPQARAEIRDQLIYRTDAYTSVFVGVGYYLKHQLRPATRYFKRALASHPDGSTASLLKLLLGNVADQGGDHVAAKRYYTAALRDRVTRARAEFGLGEVLYESARGRCERGHVSPPLLWKARSAFAPEVTDPSLTAKAYFGLGQVDLCLSASRTANRWRLAQAEFATVVHAYGPRAANLRDDTAEAHAGIGLCKLVLEKAPQAYVDARAEYTAAAALTTIASRRSYFEKAVRFSTRQLYEYAAAPRTHETHRN